MIISSRLEYIECVMGSVVSPKIHMLKLKHLNSQEVNIFGDGAFTNVIKIK